MLAGLYQCNLSALPKPAPSGSCAAMLRKPSCSSWRERRSGPTSSGRRPPASTKEATFSFATTSSGQVAGQTLDVLLAGDDADAKATVASFVEAGGLRPLDVGPLRRARQLEQLGFLNMAAQEPLGAGFASALKFHW